MRNPKRQPTLVGRITTLRKHLFIIVYNYESLQHILWVDYLNQSPK